MKIALCLSGFYNNTGDSNAGESGHEYLKKTIIDKYNPDVFIHSWEPQRKGYISDKYKPTNSVFESNFDFKEMFKDEGITNERFDRGFDRKNTIFKNCKIENMASFLYSRKRAIELTQSDRYDIIITTRFDIGFRGGKEVRYLKFDSKADTSYIYSADWPQHNAGYADMWFYSNEANMTTLARAYDQMYDHFRTGSGYEHAVTRAWPDSQNMDNYDSTDTKQFSNERFKDVGDRSNSLMRYPLWQCINNHLYYKWFFIANNLYDKSRFA